MNIHGSNNDKVECFLCRILLCRRTWDVFFCWKNLPAYLADMLQQCQLWWFTGEIRVNWKIFRRLIFQQQLFWKLQILYNLLGHLVVKRRVSNIKINVACFRSHKSRLLSYSEHGIFNLTLWFQMESSTQMNDRLNIANWKRVPTSCLPISALFKNSEKKSGEPYFWSHGEKAHELSLPTNIQMMRQSQMMIKMTLLASFRISHSHSSHGGTFPPSSALRLTLSNSALKRNQLRWYILRKTGSFSLLWWNLLYSGYLSRTIPWFVTWGITCYRCLRKKYPSPARDETRNKILLRKLCTQECTLIKMPCILWEQYSIKMSFSSTFSTIEMS